MGGNMKKFISLILTILLLVVIAVPCLAFADEATDTTDTGETTDTPDTGETTDTTDTDDTTDTPDTGDTTDTPDTVTVDAELWNEIVAMLEKIKEAETADDVSEIVYETFFTRMTAWFGDNANTIILILQVLFIAVWTIINRKSKFKLANGITAAYEKTKEIYSSDERIKQRIDEIAESLKGSQITDKDRKTMSATLELMWTMLNNSSAIPTVKANGKQIYDDAHSDNG